MASQEKLLSKAAMYRNSTSGGLYRECSQMRPEKRHHRTRIGGHTDKQEVRNMKNFTNKLDEQRKQKQTNTMAGGVVSMYDTTMTKETKYSEPSRTTGATFREKHRRNRTHHCFVLDSPPRPSGWDPSWLLLSPTAPLADSMVPSHFSPTPRARLRNVFLLVPAVHQGRSFPPIRVNWVSMEQHWNARGMGDPRENPPTIIIVRNEFHMRKSGSHSAGDGTQLAKVGGE
ncbi:hypothetical protein PR048_030986 [Dryococelus australis]|uniref:Uncharacterized protein n=1 Tax=Dryococelus australis TaxID=614101 RepID=A0ABQ9G6W2_9NEOP|nr:hypothetical protein PR048_030986 [Dryococelus australis]